MAGSIFEKLRVFSIKIWTKIEIVLNCDGRRVDFGKTEGKKKVGELPCYLAKLWGGELVEEKARGRRRNGDDSREGRHHDEEDDELSTRVVSDFTGDARMRRMVGFWGKDYFRDSQTRSLPMGSLYFCVELP